MTLVPGLAHWEFHGDSNVPISEETHLSAALLRVKSAASLNDTELFSETYSRELYSRYNTDNF